MKLQWKSISEDQEERFSEFRDRKALVGLFFYCNSHIHYEVPEAPL